MFRYKNSLTVYRRSVEPFLYWVCHKHVPNLIFVITGSYMNLKCRNLEVLLLSLQRFPFRQVWCKINLFHILTMIHLIFTKIWFRFCPCLFFLFHGLPLCLNLLRVRNDQHIPNVTNSRDTEESKMTNMPLGQWS